MNSIDELTTMYSLNSNETARLHWVVNTYPNEEHDKEIVIELKNIMAARKLATMPKVSREKIKKAQDRAAMLELENIDL